MSQEQMTLFSNEASIRADEGINRAIDHAEREHQGWAERAFSYLKYYIETHSKPFLVETVRKYAENKGLPNPPSNRAWGAIIRRAQREGLVEARGYMTTSNPRAHKTPATLWISLAYIF